MFISGVSKGWGRAEWAKHSSKFKDTFNIINSIDLQNTGDNAKFCLGRTLKQAWDRPRVVCLKNQKTVGSTNIISYIICKRAGQNVSLVW